MLDERITPLYIVALFTDFLKNKGKYSKKRFTKKAKCVIIIY